MPQIEFTPEEKALMVAELKDYFERELDQELDRFETEFLIKALSKRLGAYFYNRGLWDAQEILSQRLDALTSAISELEEPVD
ncbi:MAG: DUF2164 domain-containing protein [Actinomycetia bacterium]|nr:DUF2164 domain-containing protein [Actinomycetes bacterium]